MVKDLQYITILDTINYYTDERNYRKLNTHIYFFDGLIKTKLKEEIINEWKGGYLIDITNKIILENTAIALELTNYYRITNKLKNNNQNQFYIFSDLIRPTFNRFNHLLSEREMIEVVCDLIEGFNESFISNKNDKFSYQDYVFTSADKVFIKEFGQNYKING
jgi:hypothetical protein